MSEPQSTLSRPSPSATPNPFTGLFTSVIEAENYTPSTEQSLKQSGSPKETINVQAKTLLEVNEIIEQVFQITLQKESLHTEECNPSLRRTPNQLVFLEDLSCRISPQDWIDVEILEQALFERLLLEEPQNHALFKDATTLDAHVYQTQVIKYLFECHKRLLEFSSSTKYKHLAEPVSIMINYVSRNAATALKQPEFFEAQQLNVQIIDLFSALGTDTTITGLKSFFQGIVNEFLKEDGEDGCVESLLLAFQSTLIKIEKDLGKANLFLFRTSHFNLLQVFSENSKLALVLISHSMPKNNTSGRAFANTLFGSMLNLSCLPKSPSEEFDYFDNNWGSQDGMTVVEENIWRCIQTIQENVFVIFHSLLKCSPEVKHQLLLWLGNCLHSNAARGRLENLSFAFPSAPSVLCVSDGFMVNLSGVLLRLCEPFCSNTQDSKLLRIDPTYCAVTSNEVNQDAHNKGVHLLSLAEETCLIPVPDGTTKPVALGFGLVTECFFMTHRALDLGFRVVMEGLTQVSREMSRIEQALRGGRIRPDMIQALQDRLDDNIKKFKSLRASLLEPKVLDLMVKFHGGTAIWLTQVNVSHCDMSIQKSFAPTVFYTVKFPLPDQVPATLSCIPEFLIENQCYFLTFIRRFRPQIFEDHGLVFLEPLLTQILVFMGSIHRMRNPHLRARLAEALESFLPDQPDQQRQLIPTFYREQLFKKHPHRKQIIECLLDVFVGIEMTGQSVEFEQKFNYRRPMYLVMKYLWKIEEQKESFRELAREAEQHMEAVTPPLFLRFINLLINDAVFLLDEALTNMAQLRQMQTARDAGEWEQLSVQEREQNESSLIHTGMIARFDNILGRETIQTLLFLTSDITNIFTHPTMVDRIAAMLNYFLYNLVGPKMKTFKVKDQKEFEFEPATIVRSICEIYVHLHESDSFCTAVSQDGRSYSPQLFNLTEDVLARISGGSLIVDMQTVGAKVALMASKQQTEDEILVDAPEEFLDPIMNSLMTDPVILPSSNKTVDRSTIARHILSDQSDPFNRSPLTMDMLVPNNALRTQIQTWIEEKKAKLKSSD